MVATGMTTVMTPNATPRTPRNAISHQLWASAAPRASGIDVVDLRARSSAAVVLIIRLQTHSFHLINDWLIEDPPSSRWDEIAAGALIDVNCNSNRGGS
jgi:hypothetical protein